MPIARKPEMSRKVLSDYPDLPPASKWQEFIFDLKLLLVSLGIAGILMAVTHLNSG